MCFTSAFLHSGLLSILSFFKDDVRYDTISDVRKQLRVFEEIDEVERKHRETREREMLMRVAKVGGLVNTIFFYIL